MQNFQNTLKTSQRSFSKIFPISITAPLIHQPVNYGSHWSWRGSDIIYNYSQSI